jgi:hypothetical protein
MLAKRFLSVCGGLLMLTVAYQLGAISAHAQSGQGSGGILKQITTRDLIIVDERGKERARLGTEEGVTSLALDDQTGTLRAALVLYADGYPSLLLNDANGTPRAALQVTQDAALLSLVIKRERRACRPRRKTSNNASLNDESGVSERRQHWSQRPRPHGGIVRKFDRERHVIWQMPVTPLPLTSDPRRPLPSALRPSPTG